MKITSQHIIILFFLSGVFGVEVKTVLEGDSVTINPDLTEIHTYSYILWRFGSELIAEIYEDKISYRPGPDGSFRDRLRLDSETGSLTITNMKMKHSSPYKLDAIGSTSGTTYKTFNVSVYESPSAIHVVEVEMKSVSVTTGESLTLQTDVLHPRDELIVWRFGEEGKLIAKADLEANNSLHEDIDERFRDRLKLDKTGSLTIMNSRITDSGLYIVKISSSKQTLHKKFSVTVIETGLSPGAVAGIAVGCSFVGIFVIWLVTFIFYCCVECWKPSNLKIHILEISKELSKISETMTDLPKTYQQLSEISEKLKKLSKISEKDLSEEDKTKLSGICDKLDQLLTISRELKNMSDNCVNMPNNCANMPEISEELKNLSEISEKLKKLFEGKISEKLLKISTKLSKISGKLNQLLSVKEGETALLETGVENRENVKIFWRFGKSLLAVTKEGADPIIHNNVLRGRFKGRLELDKETGSLRINNTNTGDSGEYTVRIKSSTKQQTFLKFTVSVSENGASESAAVEIPLLSKEQQSSV